MLLQPKGPTKALLISTFLANSLGKLGSWKHEIAQQERPSCDCKRLQGSLAKPGAAKGEGAALGSMGIEPAACGSRRRLTALLCCAMLARGVDSFSQGLTAALDGSHSRTATTRCAARLVTPLCGHTRMRRHERRLAGWQAARPVLPRSPRRAPNPAAPQLMLKALRNGRWGLRYKPAAYPRLVGWAPRGCPLRPGSLEPSQVACRSGEEVCESLQLRKIGAWESFGPDQRQNFTRAVWTCQSPAQILFAYDEEECHYIHEGRARVSIIPSALEKVDGVVAGDKPLEVYAGDCLVTPAGARVCWDILEPIKKKTTCREPFRMVSQGWILAPPLASCFTSNEGGDEAANTHTLRRTMSASALIDTLQEGLTQRGLRNRLS